jgi:hypothetical protein
MVPGTSGESESLGHSTRSPYMWQRATHRCTAKSDDSRRTVADSETAVSPSTSRGRMSKHMVGKADMREPTRYPNAKSPSLRRGVSFQGPEGWGFDPGRGDAAPLVRQGRRAGTRLRFFDRSRRLRFTVVNRLSRRTRYGSTWALHWLSRKSNTSAQPEWSRIWGREAPVGSCSVSTSRKRGRTSDRHIRRWAWMNRAIPWV